jgi:DNA-directed RNA polymerase subunit F
MSVQPEILENIINKFSNKDLTLEQKNFNNYLRDFMSYELYLKIKDEITPIIHFKNDYPIEEIYNIKYMHFIMLFIKMYITVKDRNDLIQFVAKYESGNVRVDFKANIELFVELKKLRDAYQEKYKDGLPTFDTTPEIVIHYITDACEIIEKRVELYDYDRHYYMFNPRETKQETTPLRSRK